MADDRHNRQAACDIDHAADQVTLQRLLKGFRREEEEYHRNHLLYGDDHIERDQEKGPRPSK